MSRLGGASVAFGTKIMHIVTRHVPFGAGRNICATLAWELERGYEVHVVVGSRSETSFPDGVLVHTAPDLDRDLSPLKDLQAVRQIRRLIGICNPQIIQTHKSKAGILGRLAARSAGRVIVHTIHMPSFGRGYSAAASRIFLECERYSARFTDLFVAVGEEVKLLYVQAGIGREAQYHVVRSPIDLQRFLTVRSSGKQDHHAWRRQFGLPLDSPVLVAAGLLERRKRFGLLIERLSPLLASGGAVLVIAGSGPEELELKSLTSRLGLARKVKFLGFVPDVEKLFAVADMLVHCASTEGVPQVVIQAFAAGLPVVATDMIGLREVPCSPIRIVDPDGDRLLAACKDVISGPAPTAVRQSALHPWSSLQVQRDLERLHVQLTLLTNRHREA
jgi:glycosyltransferase involved in cell wall biosynthesis